VDVIVLDGHRMVGQAIAGVLAEVAGFEVLGICSAVDEACVLIGSHPPDLLVLDVEFGDGDYREAVDFLRRLNPAAELLFLTALAERFQPPADLAGMTVAVVDKAQSWDDLLMVLRTWWQRRPDHLRDSLPGCEWQLNAIDQLPPRELRLLNELGHGQLNKQIAARLGLSPSTVESYRKNVAAKLGVSGSELVRLAVLYRCLNWHHQSPLDL
jgi:DNA-binding NarL/FixJ family response regulator